MSKIQLPEAVAKEFELVNWPSETHPTLHFGPKIGDVDLKTLTLTKARGLALHKVKFLKPRNKPEAQSKAAAAASTNKLDKK